MRNLFPGIIHSPEEILKGALATNLTKQIICFGNW